MLSRNFDEFFLEWCDVWLATNVYADDPDIMVRPVQVQQNEPKSGLQYYKSDNHDDRTHNVQSTMYNEKHAEYSKH